MAYPSVVSAWDRFQFVDLFVSDSDSAGGYKENEDSHETGRVGINRRQPDAAHRKLHGASSRQWTLANSRSEPALVSDDSARGHVDIRHTVWCGVLLSKE